LADVLCRLNTCYLVGTQLLFMFEPSPSRHHRAAPSRFTTPYPAYTAPLPRLHLCLRISRRLLRHITSYRSGGTVRWRAACGAPLPVSALPKTPHRTSVSGLCFPSKLCALAFASAHLAYRAHLVLYRRRGDYAYPPLCLCRTLPRRAILRAPLHSSQHFLARFFAFYHNSSRISDADARRGVALCVPRYLCCACP